MGMVPSKWILTPELLIPGRKPAGSVPVELDRQHPALTRGGHWFGLLEGGGSKIYDSLGTLEGTLTNGAAWQSDGGIYLDGTNDAISLGDPSSVDFGDDDFYMFIDCTPLETNNYEMFVGKDAVGGRQFFMGTYGDSGFGDYRKILFSFFSSGSECIKRSGAIVNFGQRNRILCQRTGSTIEIYHDGELVASGLDSGTPGTLDATSTNLAIGRRQYTGHPNYLKGTVFAAAIQRGSLPQPLAIAMTRDPYQVYRPTGLDYLPFTEPTVAAGAFMPQLMKNNLGADLYNGTFL